MAQPITERHLAYSCDESPATIASSAHGGAFDLRPLLCVERDNSPFLGLVFSQATTAGDATEFQDAAAGQDLQTTDPTRGTPIVPMTYNPRPSQKLTVLQIYSW